MTRMLQALLLAAVAIALAACAVTAPIAHTTGTKSQVSQDRIPFEPTPPEILATLSVPVLVEYIQDRIQLIRTNPKWERGKPTLRVALDELASRGRGEAYEVLVTSLSDSAFSRQFDDNHQVRLGTRWRVNKKGQREVAYKLAAGRSVLSSDDTRQAYKILRSLASAGYGAACAKFRRAYNSVGAPPDSYGARLMRAHGMDRRGVLLGVAGEPEWDEATWEAVNGLARRDIPSARIARDVIIPIPADVVAGCRNATKWSSLTGEAADWSGQHANPNIDVANELEDIRHWATEWQRTTVKYESGKHRADELWRSFEADYRTSLARIAHELSRELDRRGLTIKVYLAELDQTIFRWHKTRGPFYLTGSDIYAGRQLAAGSDWVARQKMRNRVIQEEKRLVANGVQVSPNATPLYFVTMASRALGKRLGEFENL